MTTMATSLIMTLHVGAAFYDGTLRQRTKLREALKGGTTPSLLERYRRHEVDEAALYAAIDEAMGTEWTPGGDYGAQIAALTPGKSCGRCHGTPVVDDLMSQCRHCVQTHKVTRVESVTVRRRRG